MAYLPDGISFGDAPRGGMNLYAYVHNDPVNFRDPSGLITFNVGGNTTAVVGDSSVNPGGTYGSGWCVRVEWGYLEFGTYEQTGDAVGLDIDVSVTAGVTFDSEDFEGDALSAGYDAGLGSVNVSVDPASGEWLGVEFGGGPGEGMSVSETTTTVSPVVSFGDKPGSGSTCGGQ